MTPPPPASPSHSSHDPMSVQETVEDGFGGVWRMCDRVTCGLQVVRPGKVQCWCDSDRGPSFLPDVTVANPPEPTCR